MKVVHYCPDEPSPHVIFNNLSHQFTEPFETIEHNGLPCQKVAYEYLYAFCRTTMDIMCLEKQSEQVALMNALLKLEIIMGLRDPQSEVGTYWGVTFVPANPSVQ